MMLRLLVVAVLVCGLAFATVQAEPSVERGRYLVQIAGCNDCHTPGYGLKNGAVPESEWLVGDPTGWNGPWGTTYAINLRAHAHAMSEADWVRTVRTVQARPPMPWYVLHQMSLEAISKIPSQD